MQVDDDRAKPDTFTTAQAAARLGVAPNSVILWADAGLLQSWRTPGGHRRISADSVQAMIAKRRDRDAANRARALQVLLVEDDPDTAAVLQDQVSEVLPQARVATVGDGFAALVHAGRDVPALMIMDVNLPGMNGLAMIESLRALQPTSKVRFVLISGYQAHELASFGTVPDDVPFLHKPVSTDALRDAIGRALQAQR